MQHRGEIVEIAVRESGISISKLALLLGKSRRWVYLLFSNEQVPLDYVIQIGRLIQHDFSTQLDELKSLSDRHDFKQQHPSNENDYLYWKTKYFELLEETYHLLKLTKPKQDEKN